MLVTKPGFKALYFVLGAIAGVVLVIAVGFADIEIGAGVLRIIPGLLLFGGARFFVGLGENPRTRREFRRATNKPVTGYVLGVVFALYSLFILPFTIALVTRTYAVHVLPPIDYWGSLVSHLLQVTVNALLAVFYFQSSIRMSRPIDLARQPGQGTPAIAKSSSEGNGPNPGSATHEDGAGEGAEPIVASCNIVVDARLARRFTTEFYWRAALRPQRIASNLVRFSFAGFAAAVFVSGAVVARPLSGVIAVGLTALFLYSPVSDYLKVRNAQQKSIGTRREATYTESGFVLKTARTMRSYRYDSIATIRETRDTVALTAITGRRIYIRSELMPSDRVSWVRERITHQREASRLPRNPLDGEPTSFTNHSIVDEGSPRRWARAALLRSMFNDGKRSANFWWDVVFALLGLINLLLPGNIPAWGWTLLLLSGTYSAVVPNVVLHRRVLASARSRLQVGDVWESEFTSTHFWLRGPDSTHQSPYSRLAEIRVLYGYTVIQITGIPGTVQIPAELFSKDQAEKIRQQLTPEPTEAVPA